MIAPLVYEKKKVGVGFMPGSRLGYMPGARLGYMPGSMLGDFSTSMENAALDATPPIAPNDIDLLNNLGATDQDLTNLMNGNISLAQLYANYGVTIAPAATTAAPPAATTGQSPPGSQLLYTAQFTSSIHTGAAVIAALTAGLPAHGMSTTGAQVTATSAAGTSPTAIQVQISDQIGHTQFAHVKSVCDSIVNSATGNNLGVSDVQPISIPGQTAVAATSALLPAASVPASGLMTAQSVFPGITNETLIIGALAVGLVFMFKGKR